MLGAIVGDIVGSRFEFNNHRSKDFDLFAEGCFATDDSIMTLAVAKAIMEAIKVEIVKNNIKQERGRYISPITARTGFYEMLKGRHL